MYNRDDYTEVPERVLDSLDAHGQTGRPTGSFLHAVLTNDLFTAVGYADPTSMAALKKIVTYVNCQLPPGCRGSVEKVKQWRNECNSTS